MFLAALPLLAGAARGLFGVGGLETGTRPRATGPAVGTASWVGTLRAGGPFGRALPSFLRSLWAPSANRTLGSSGRSRAPGGGRGEGWSGADAGPERRHRDVVRRAHGLRLRRPRLPPQGPAGPTGRAGADRRRDPRVHLRPQERDRPARRRDPGSAADRHPAVPDLPARLGDQVLAPRHRGQPRRQDPAGGAQPRRLGGDHQHGDACGALRERRPLSIRRRDHPKRALRTCDRRDRGDGVGDQPRHGQRHQDDPGRSAPLASRGHGGRPEGAARLRRQRQPGRDRGDQHRHDDRAANPLGRAPAGAGDDPDLRQRHPRRLQPAVSRLGRGRGGGLRPLRRGPLRSLAPRTPTLAAGPPPVRADRPPPGRFLSDHGGGEPARQTGLDLGPRARRGAEPQRPESEVPQRQR